jgi:hypothetical protein
VPPKLITVRQAYQAGSTLDCHRIATEGHFVLPSQPFHVRNGWSALFGGYRAVHASRGKAVRAEPIAALYEQRRVHHVGTFPMLEDQMPAFTSDFDRGRAGYSPDHVDALVWALTELMVEPVAGWG